MLGWSSLSSGTLRVQNGTSQVWTDSVSRPENPLAASVRLRVFSSALGLDYIFLASLFLPTSPSPPLTHPLSSQLLPSPPCSALPVPSRGFSERYLISVRAGLTAIQYAFSLFVLVGETESFSRGSG